MGFLRQWSQSSNAGLKRLWTGTNPLHYKGHRNTCGKRQSGDKRHSRRWCHNRNTPDYAIKIQLVLYSGSSYEVCFTEKSRLYWQLNSHSLWLSSWVANYFWLLRCEHQHSCLFVAESRPCQWLHTPVAKRWCSYCKARAHSSGAGLYCPGRGCLSALAPAKSQGCLFGAFLGVVYYVSQPVHNSLKKKKSSFCPLPLFFV